MIDIHRRELEWASIQDNLKVADIILTRKDPSIISGAIRRQTKSYWSHAAMVFAVPEKGTRFNNVLVVEAMGNGIEIHRIQKYIKHFRIFDIGVKRMPGLNDKERERILAFMLNNVDVPYDTTRLFLILLRTLTNRIFPWLSTKMINKDDFICTSFIQKAFIEAVPDDRKDAVTIKETSGSNLHLEDITPKDLARTNILEWVYNRHV
ncbi:YiiX/YebB-like N1pC/P60 family cysteine hydrolase [Patescibacteria group bacterium]